MKEYRGKTNAAFIGFLLLFSAMTAIGAERLDRRAIVGRHLLTSESATMTVPLANGEFCFNVDGTGLQTLAGSTLDHRGWFSIPLPDGYAASDVPATGTFQKGRNTGPDVFPQEKQSLQTWLFDNPHRMNLARIRLTRADGSSLEASAIQNVRRTLDLWTGLHRSEFSVDGEAFLVETAVGDSDSVAIRAVSKSLADGKIVVTIDFPYPTSQDGAWVGDFGANDRHATVSVAESPQGQTFVRRFGANGFGDYDYSVRIERREKNPVTIRATGPNAFALETKGKTLEFAVSFGNYSLGDPRPSEETKTLFAAFAPLTERVGANESLYETLAAESVARWERYWLSGGAIDLSGSLDPRWKELERRIVFSQYLMKTSASGSFPPPEVGLLGIDYWRGQFHMEMVWWHLAHWFLWERENEADRPLQCYVRFKKPAAELAKQLGYKGYKWQKSCGPEGRTAPWSCNQVLLWKQPHPIFFAELEYRARPTEATVQKWADLVEQTAVHMADYVTPDDKGVYHLNPVMPPSELGIVQDTTYDLAYWKLGLEWANRWRIRSGLEPVGQWETIRKNLSPFPRGKDGLYLRTADWPEWKTWEHPDLIGAFGNFPAIEGFDEETAKKTIAEVVRRWEWDRCWGWDFPWTAMAAARTGQPELAVEMLLSDSPRNRYDERGVNLGGPCPYLPGNGGLLYAIALMTAGWDGGPQVENDNNVHEEAPGFPQNGQWRVRWENLRPAP